MARVMRVPEPEPERRPEHDPEQRRRRLAGALRRGSRWASWTAASVAALLVFVWILSYALERPLTGYMQRAVNERLKGYTASVGRAHFNPFNLSMNLWDVSLVKNAHPEPAIARLPHVWADLEWAALLHGRIVATFEFVEPVLYLDRNHIEAEARDPTPVKERGWPEALEAIYPFKMDVFRVRNGTITYVEKGGTRPLPFKAVNIEAHNIRNIRSRDREFPSRIYADAIVFERGRAVIDGRADFLGEPHVTFKGDVRLDQIPFDHLAPVLARYHVAVRKGTLAAEGSVEYGRNSQTAVLRTLEISGIDADYVYQPAAARPEQRVAQQAAEKASEVGNAPQTDLRAETIRVAGTLGFINRAVTPPYRVFFSDIELTVRNFSNRFEHGPAVARATAKFMGSGATEIAARFRSETNGPDFDLAVKLEDTDMTTMNDLLRAYGKFDVVGGLFSLYSELHVKNRRVDGYIKPLFRELKVYDKRTDADRSAFQKLSERLIGGLSKLLENRTPRREVATKTTIHGELDGGPTKISTGQALVNLVRNAFFSAILPGFDAEVRGAER
jgi:hypothetical protein